MPSTESVSHEDLILCACGGREYNTRDVIDAGLWRGDVDDLWQRFLLRCAAEKMSDEQEMDIEDDALDSAAETFRYERDLITAEETEQWLTARHLTLDDFSDYFARQYWGNRLGEEITVPDTAYIDSGAEDRRLFAAELILSGDLDWLTTKLVWRLAAAKADSGAEENEHGADSINNELLERTGMTEGDLANWLANLGRDAAWLNEMESMERAYRRRCESVLAPQALKHELGALRLPLTRFETEVVELESRDAAQEALFCVREDGMSMEEVAREGRYPYRRVDFLLEDLPADLQQLFMSVQAGQVLEPVARTDGFELCRVIRKTEPDGADPTVKERVEQRLLDRHFAELAGRHVDRRLGAVIEPA
jgi:hypothetical protein